jgi:hypothetical protein
MSIDYDDLRTAMLARSTLQANNVRCALNVGQEAVAILHELTVADTDSLRAAAILRVADLMPKYSTLERRRLER